MHIDEHGDWHDLPTGEAGVLAIHGPAVFPGYVTAQGPGGPVLDTLGSVRDGWLNTGDLGRVDEDGFVYLSGRAKDLIIRGGHNIDPAVIEDALLSHPDVTAAGAVGRPDPHAGEVPVAYVTLTPQATVTTEELRSWAAAHVPEQAAAPKEVTVIDALPLTDVGKPSKIPLRLDAARNAVSGALTAIGYDRLATLVDCHLEDARLRVALPSPEDRGSRDRVAALLDQYVLRWKFTAGEPLQ